MTEVLLKIKKTAKMTKTAKTVEINFDCQPITNNKAIISVYHELLKGGSDALNLRPPYQRSPVWDDDQKGNLVDSVMKRCPMPVFLLYQHAMETPECIDGQNRLTAIKEYIEQEPSESRPCCWAWVIDNSNNHGADEEGEEDEDEDEDEEDKQQQTQQQTQQHDEANSERKKRKKEEKKEEKEIQEYVFYLNPATKDAMQAHCDLKNKMVRGKKKKHHRLMTKEEAKRFESYQCTISEIQTKLTLMQRKDIFLRWQNGTGISQCDKFKNRDSPFCMFLRDEQLEKTLVPRISAFLKTDRKNWLWDIYRLLNVFLEGNTMPASVFISTLKARGLIDAQSVDMFNLEEIQYAIRRCEKFMGRMQFLQDIHKKMYFSLFLAIAFLWHTALPHIRDVMEQKGFLLPFVTQLLADDTLCHNTLNNGIHEASVLLTFPQIQMRLTMACEQQKAPIIDSSSNSSCSSSSGKKRIPAARKTEVWDHYIGVTIGKAKCVCCATRDITARDFITGHVISEHDGGTIDLDNLRPICAVCNTSMGTKNMIAYMKTMYPANKLVDVVAM